ncbi:uncharacterized protein HMPREF1541_06109 [Cyphellophora europaea CBS 101466]|uniref:SigF-like NTF2-like domain-containing protein n=1 Tax=Cyphellophora europaea (strain CBS 101466) TaxID=1220924 RepID=W2RVW0_CYPE1|nr:uncharacterized protein HMPREF1541_06109 [Cyphellophora europaea CBS 101466]ETN39883.1 hypothetical protein HMPREF1541_06109 [Cyphellophora europaea CBS 101466]
MENPVEEITGVITTLCTAESEVQQQAIDKYFTQDALFIHPFCRTLRVSNSTWMIKKIYAWYKILSPHIDIKVDSIAFDQANMILYVTARQTFRIQFIPLYKADVSLVTKLQLTHVRDAGLDPSYAGVVKQTPGATASQAQKYYIQSQNDLYQTNEFIKFVAPWGVGSTIVILWQIFATLMCVVGAMILWPLTWFRENLTNEA